MKFAPSAIVFAAALSSPSSLLVRANFFRNDFLPVGHVRTDAIITQDCLSDHVHTFYGPPLLHPAVTFDELRASDPQLSSGNIMENQSLYWHPAVYHVADDGTKTLQESGMWSRISVNRYKIASYVPVANNFACVHSSYSTFPVIFSMCVYYIYRYIFNPQK